MALLTSPLPWRRPSVLSGSRPGISPLRRLGAVVAVFCALLGASALAAENANQKEYQLKAVFLLNFVQFVIAWPEGAFPNAEAPIRVGVLGEDPFGGALAAAVESEKVGQRSVVIERVARLEDIGRCHVLFVAKSESAQVPAIIAASAGKPVLTVGDMTDFARRGGIINFYLEGPKLRFEINRTAAERSGIKLSSQLLQLARLVGPPVSSGDR